MKSSIKLLACALVLLLLLAGCVQPPEAEYSETGWRYSQYRVGAFSDEGYYYIVDLSYLYFMDTSNGISVCLCSRPGCLHEKEEDVEKRDLCEANIGIPRAMWFWEDHLYYIAFDAYGAHIYRRDATGMNLTEVADIGTKHTEEKRSLSITYYIHLGESLYYEAEVGSSAPDSSGWADFSYIARIDLNTCKEEELITGRYLVLHAANQDGFLFGQNEDLELDYEDPNYVEEFKKLKTESKYWNIKTGQITTILSSTCGEFGGVTAVDGDKMYYLRNSDSCTMEYDWKTGEHREIATLIRQINGHYAYRQEENGYTLYDLRAGKQLNIDLKADNISVHVVSDEAFILTVRMRAPEGNQYITTYNYVTLASLADGLQEKDLLPVYTVGLD